MCAFCVFYFYVFVICCHYCFFNNGFKFKIFVFNGCHDLTVLWVSISDIAIAAVKYCQILIIVVLFTKLENLKQFIEKFCTCKSWVYTKMHTKVINIKNQVYNYHFNNRN